MRERIDFRCASCSSQLRAPVRHGWPGLFLSRMRRSRDRTRAPACRRAAHARNGRRLLPFTLTRSLSTKPHRRPEAAASGRFSCAPRCFSTSRLQIT